jgi:hypothetical protein
VSSQPGSPGAKAPGAPPSGLPTPGTPPSGAQPSGTPPGVAPGKPEVFRMTAPLVLWWVWLAFAVANAADLAVQRPGHFALEVVAILATVTGVAYACALRPRVIAGDAGLSVLNPLRDYRVPWGAVRSVDTGDWVRVHCAPGTCAPGAATGAASGDGGAHGSGGKVIESWALYVPARSRLRPSRRMKDLAIRTAAGARLPEEARELMSLPAAQAIAARLDRRAARERDRGAAGGPLVARWAWPSLAAMILPAIALLIIVLT